MDFLQQLKHDRQAESRRMRSGLAVLDSLQG